ncbi:3-oxoacyl-ACP synthase III family protein [Chitinimonas lacunae]|uniref:3-oxoacyl-ACP synthase III family protein n=1 Tax=Chitinimonas lacunae TaxID=1963018 RepID=A0ABV8MPM0_9NEIS
MPFCQIAAISSYVPERVLDNDALAALYPEWSAAKIFEKTGIRERRIADEGQTSLDLAERAAQALWAEHGIDPAEIDFLLFCTQTPDYFLPTSACVLQQRLGLRRNCGALDINLGCSGFVYGLSLAKALIESGQAGKVLLLTADTYSKLIHPQDKSVRTLFGDGASATLISTSANDAAALGPFVFGTDGSGANELIVPTGGFRRREAAGESEAEDESGNIRGPANLYMNGPAIMAFTLTEVPAAIRALLDRAGLTLEQIDYFVFHQANRFILDALRKKLKIPPEKFVIWMEDIGNTVSSTIPIALSKTKDAWEPGRRVMLVGFGGGYSWCAGLATI